jgi:hypothetical protein
LLDGWRVSQLLRVSLWSVCGDPEFRVLGIQQVVKEKLVVRSFPFADTSTLRALETIKS